MADEFIKGTGILTGGGLAWMTLASWYRTSSFESTKQLVEPVIRDPANVDVFNSLAITLMDVLFWFTIIGTLTFWVLIPAGRQARAALEARQATSE